MSKLTRSHSHSSLDVKSQDTSHDMIGQIQFDNTDKSKDFNQSSLMSSMEDTESEINDSRFNDISCISIANETIKDPENEVNKSKDLSGSSFTFAE